MRLLLLPLIILALAGCDSHAQPEPAGSSLTPGDSTAWSQPTLYIEGNVGVAVIHYGAGSGYAYVPRPGTNGASTFVYSGELPGTLNGIGADGTRWRFDLPTDPGPDGEGVGTCVLEAGMVASEWTCAYRWLSPPAPPANAGRLERADG